ncbi:hypothetical protein G7Z17_g9307 [Cylindrodendrum hubeiense]|uniref:Uncharacterized protein n=1 Tax=Cylindrodendrum hubeiense TaxID=595255 RepID=A0A9P5LDH3_9HYPO|nr:hypothetical protein G7Z17_g9307 [Cylindrodendrum hubeiense]
MPASRIFLRADSCDADQVTCPSTLPSNFCCSENTTCKALAGGTTAVCCPEGSSCDLIRPITCNLSEQNVTNRPNASIKTTVFNVALEACGDNTCCPFGYSCNDDSECIMDDDQSKAPSGSETSTTSTTAAPSVTSTTISSSTDIASTDIASTTETASFTAAPEQSSGSESDSSSGNSGPATTSIIGGVVGGCLLLLVLAIIVFLCIRRRNKGDGSRSEKSGGPFSHARAASSTGSFGNIISEPITQPNSYRTDFILKSSCSSTLGSRTLSPSRTLVQSPSRTFVQSPSNTLRISPTPPRIRISIPNPFDSPNPSPNHQSVLPSPIDEEPRHGNVRLLPIRSMKASSYCSRRPSTPELQREPSSESINVFADPGDVTPRPLTRATRFTDLMDEADLGEVRRGRPYVPGTTPRI